MNNNFLYITRSSPRASITSIFLQVLDNLSKCEKENLIPIISMKNSDLLCYDLKYGNNVWEYYFEPVSEFSDNTLSAKQKKNKKIRSSFISKPQNLHYYLGIAGEQKSYISRFKNGKPPSFDFSHRNYFKKIIDKYIRIKPNIIKEKNNFFNKHMKNKKIVGTFARGTNKFNSKSGNASFRMGKKLEVDDYIKKCQHHMEAIGADYVYLISDSHESVRKFEKEFGDNLICHKKNMRYKYHSSDIDPQWNDPDYGPMDGKTKGDAGKENIIDTLCLAECDFIIHPETNMAIAAMLYNPNVKHEFIGKK